MLYFNLLFSSAFFALASFARVSEYFTIYPSYLFLSLNSTERSKAKLGRKVSRSSFFSQISFHHCIVFSECKTLSFNIFYQKITFAG